MPILKRALIAILALAVISALIAFLLLRSMGFFRSPEYSTTIVELPELPRPAILVLHKTNGFIHKEGLPAATQMLTELSRANGWSVYQTDNAAFHNESDLLKFDLVVWNNTTGDLLTVEQRGHFRSWIEQGGSWLGLHAAGGDRNYDWEWYRDTLIGAQFFGHTMTPQFQDASAVIATKSNLTSHLPSPWTIKQEEWYAFDRNPRDTGSTILLALDETSYDTSETFFAEPSMPGEHPIAWTHDIGQGQIIYSAIGHQAKTYSVPEYREFIQKSMRHLIEARQTSTVEPVDE